MFWEPVNILAADKDHAIQPESHVCCGGYAGLACRPAHNTVLSASLTCTQGDQIADSSFWESCFLLVVVVSAVFPSADIRLCFISLAVTGVLPRRHRLQQSKMKRRSERETGSSNCDSAVFVLGEGSSSIFRSVVIRFIILVIFSSMSSVGRVAYLKVQQVGCSVLSLDHSHIPPLMGFPSACGAAWCLRQTSHS